MVEKKKNKSRQEIDREKHQKRKLTPTINTIRGVPQETIEQLEALAVIDGSKKQVIVSAIAERYRSLKNKA